MATPNTSMTATGLGNVEGGDGQQQQQATTTTTMEINQELMETLDRYAANNSGEEESVDKFPGESQEVEEEATVPVTADVAKSDDQEKNEPSLVGDEQQREEVQEEESKQQQSTNSSAAAEVMCS